jgi:CAAX prenyl protease-like protein
MVLFLGITWIEGKFPENYIWIYFAKIAVTLAALAYYRETWKDIRFEPKWMAPSVALGLVLCLLWVWIDKTITYPHFGERTAYDPFAKISGDALRAAFFAIRFFGLVVVVPVMEELFWRSFLLRYATKSDFWKLPIGVFSGTALLIVSAIFAAAHPEWLVAAIFALAMGLLLRYSKSVFACVVAHAATNLALGIYVVARSDWIYW